MFDTEFFSHCLRPESDATPDVEHMGGILQAASDHGEYVPLPLIVKMHVATPCAARVALIAD